MIKTEFLEAFQDVLQRDDAVSETEVLADMDEWDSLSKMATMAYFKGHFGVAITLDQLGKLEKVSDLIALAGNNIK